jgi:hypothetical protein
MGSRALQKLITMCDRQLQWINIIGRVSSTLIPLHLGIVYGPYHLTRLDGLRHLQASLYTHAPLKLELNAPRP